MNLDHNIKIVHKVFAKRMLPDPIITVSEWSDKFRILSTKSSAEPGRWKTSRTPYLKKIMDCMSSNSAYQHIIVQKGAQIGFSEMGNNWLGYIIDQNPGPVMIVQPTLDMAKRFSKQRVDSLIDDCDALSSKIKDRRSKDASNTVFAKEFQGGILLLTGANSAKGLRSMPIRFLFLDEVDAYPGDVDNEGDPINLAIKRTATFSRRKILTGSTPTEENRSNISKLFQITDQNFYHVPCPICKEFQILRWPQIFWENDYLGKPDLKTVGYKCEHCNEIIKEHNKTWMLNEGEWRPTVEENINSKRIGFHLSSLYSPLGWYSWSDAVEDYHEAQNRIEKLKGFVNTVLGEVWTDKGDAPDWKRLYDRRESYQIGKVPKEGLILTCAVDVQKDRLELEIKAWGRDMRSWSVDYRFIAGDTTQEKVWNELSRLLSERFDHESGAQLMISKMAVDSGYNTQAVYNWCRKWPIQRVVALKGADSLRQIVARPRDVDVRYDGKKIRRGAKLFMIGSSMIKSEVFGWLKQDKSYDDVKETYGFPHFPEYDEEYFKMLCSEELRKKKVKGFDRWYWEKIRDRNEALDLFVMNRAAAYLIGIDRYQENDWHKLESELAIAKKGEKIDNVIKPTRKIRIKRKKSNFLG